MKQFLFIKKCVQNISTTNTTDEYQKIDEDLKYRGIYKAKFIIPDRSEPTNAEQSVFNKLSDKDGALEYLLYYFYFILFLDTSTKLWNINLLNAILL
jgi:hypothetical protein